MLFSSLKISYPVKVPVPRLAVGFHFILISNGFVPLDSTDMDCGGSGGRDKYSVGTLYSSPQLVG